MGWGGGGESVPKMKKCVIQNVDFLRLRSGRVRIFRFFQMCMYTLNLSFNKKSVSFNVNFKQFFSVLSLCFLSEGDFPKFKIFLISIFFLIWSKVGDHEIFNFSQIIWGRGNSRIFGPFPHFAKPDIAKRGNTH